MIALVAEIVVLIAVNNDYNMENQVILLVVEETGKKHSEQADQAVVDCLAVEIRRAVQVVPGLN